MKKLNIGVIGTGSISSVHLNAYQQNEHVNIYAVCDLNFERATAAALKYSVEKVFTDYKELLSDPKIDAVSICTWNNTHAEIIIAAVQAGKHVLSEKPLCKTVDEAIMVQKAVRQSGKIAQVGFVRRYDPNAQLLRKFVEQGEFGEIYYAKASYLRRLGNPGGWFADVERSGGGPLIDLGVHVIDLCWYMMGKPKVKSISGNTYHKLGNRSNIQNLSSYRAADYDASMNTVEDLASALIRFENGASLMVDVSFDLHIKQDENSVKLFGERGSFEIDPEVIIVTEKLNTIINIHPQIDNKGFNFVAAFQNEIDHFIQCIIHNKESLSPVEDGLEVMKMLCGIYESAAKGVEIHL